ncbi:MAG: efflux RND transporter periplasmic adaptor subunit [Pseudomonadota bacterium]
MKRRTAILTLILLSMILLGCSKGNRGEIIPASGYIEATEVRIGTKVPGKLASLLIAEGDAVRKGQTIARIDPVDLRLALDTANAERAQANADVNGAGTDLKRMQQLFDTGSGTAKARDDARTRFEVASARLASANAKTAQLAQQLADTAIASPLDGIITEKLAEEGELLSPGATIAVATDVRNAWLTAYVGEPDVPRIRLGQEADVTTDAAGVSRKGKITFVSSAAEFTPKNVQTRDERVKLVFKIKITIDNRDLTFKPGMPAQAKIPISAAAK